MFSAKVQTAFNFSSERIAVALLDVDDTVLLGSYSHLILKLPVISYIWSEVSADLISSFFNQSRKYYWMCFKKKKKKTTILSIYITTILYVPCKCLCCSISGLVIASCGQKGSVKNTDVDTAIWPNGSCVLKCFCRPQRCQFRVRCVLGLAGCHHDDRKHWTVGFSLPERKDGKINFGH